MPRPQKQIHLAAHFGRRTFPPVRLGDPGDPAAVRLASDLLGEAARQDLRP